MRASGWRSGQRTGRGIRPRSRRGVWIQHSAHSPYSASDDILQVHLHSLPPSLASLYWLHSSFTSAISRQLVFPRFSSISHVVTHSHIHYPTPSHPYHEPEEVPARARGLAARWHRRARLPLRCHWRREAAPPHTRRSTAEAFAHSHTHSHAHAQPAAARSVAPPAGLPGVHLPA